MAKHKVVSTLVETRSAVTFHLGEEECALPITHVHQIIRDTPITKVPNVTAMVEGVLNLRGVLVPVIDLKHLLGLGVRIRGDRHRLVIADFERRLVGFSVDSVNGVFTYDPRTVQQAPDVVLAKVASRFIKGVVRREVGVVIVLDTPEILRMNGERSAADAETRVAGTVGKRT